MRSVFLVVGGGGGVVMLCVKECDKDNQNSLFLFDVIYRQSLVKTLRKP